MIIPAVSGNATIETNHIMSLAPDCVPGNNGCRMQTDKYEALEMAKVSLGLNVIIANNWDIVYMRAGAPVASHMEAVKAYEGIYKFGIKEDERFDIVIAGSIGLEPVTTRLVPHSVFLPSLIRFSTFPRPL